MAKKKLVAIIEGAYHMEVLGGYFQNMIHRQAYINLQVPRERISEIIDEEPEAGSIDNLKNVFFWTGDAH